jgi:hypothetical protein
MDGQRRLAALSLNDTSSLEATHYVTDDVPGLVTEAVRLLLTAAQTGSHLAGVHQRSNSSVPAASNP